MTFTTWLQVVLNKHFAGRVKIPVHALSPSGVYLMFCKCVLMTLSDYYYALYQKEKENA